MIPMTQRIRTLGEYLYHQRAAAGRLMRQKHNSSWTHILSTAQCTQFLLFCPRCPGYGHMHVWIPAAGCNTQGQILLLWWLKDFIFLKLPQQIESYSLLTPARIKWREHVVPRPPAVLSARMSLLSKPFLSHRLMSLAAGALTKSPA